MDGEIHMNDYQDLIDQLKNVSCSGLSAAKEKFKLCAQYGMLKHGVSKELGGDGGGFQEICLAYENFGKSVRDTSLILSLNAHLWGAVFPLIRFGSEEQKKHIPNLLNGSIVAGQAITETKMGSDLSCMSALAQETEEGFLLNAHKRYITNAAIADWLIVYTKLNNGIVAFIVKRDDPNVQMTSEHQTFGFHQPSTMGEILLKDAFVPKDRLLGDAKNKIIGTMLIQYCLELERAFIFSGILGVMDWQLSKVIAFTKERKTSGQREFSHQTISHKIANMKLRLDISRLLVYECARLKDAHKKILLQSAEVKLYISEAFLQSSLDAVQILGAMGLEKEEEMMTLVDDAQASRIMSGTSEIQLNIISNLIGIK